jgi:putative endonuclease
MAKTAKRRVGDQGEEVACKYLANKGYYVIERNYWKPWGEIDIIAEKGSILSFVEVKTVSRSLSTPNLLRETPSDRISREGFRPEDNVHPAKLKRLYRAIQTYLLEKKVPETKDWQIDVACVFLDFETKKARVELLENIIL